MATPQTLVETALKATTSDECIVIASRTSSANLRWANSTLTTNGVMSGSHVSVISFVTTSGGVAVASVTRGLTAREQVKTLVSEADAAARAAGPADDAADLISGSEAADWDADPAATSIEVFEDLSRALGESFARATRDEQLLYGYAEHDVETTYLGSTTGLRLRHEQPSGFITVTGKPRDLSTSAWVGQATDDFSDVDVASLDAELVRRMGWAAHRVELDAGRYETLLPPTAVADLTIYAYWLASAREAHEGQTAYSNPAGGTRIGEQITKPGVHLRSDPGLAGIVTRPFVVTTGSTSTASVFDNGLAAPAASWIRDGKLVALMSSRHTAGLTGLDLATGIDNLVLEVDGAKGSVDDLVAGTDRGLLVTCLWYIRQVDPQSLLLTGLTRDGVYLVEGGEVTAAVNNFRFNESPLALLNRFTESGETVRSFSREWGDYFPRTMTPALRIPDFNMSSVSLAR